MIEKVAQYRKFIVAAVGALAIILGDNETYQTVVGILTAAGVVVVPNKPAASKAYALDRKRVGLSD